MNCIPLVLSGEDRKGKCVFTPLIPLVAITDFKKLINITLIEPLTEELKNISSRIVLYGSCAQGSDTFQSDLDLFIVSDDRELVVQAIGSFNFPRGFDEIHIQPVIKSPDELLGSRGI